MYLAKLYSLNNRAAINTALYIIKKYGHEMKFCKNSEILEVGTGDGSATVDTLLPLLPKDAKELVLTDKSLQMLEQAKKVPQLSKMKFVQLDIESENIPNDFKSRFDYVYSSMSLHFVRNTRQALQNIYDMLKPGGRTFCFFFSYTPADSAWTTLGQHPKWSKYDPNPFVSPYYKNPKIFEIYKAYLEEFGFNNIFIRPEEYIYHFESYQEFKDLLKAVNLSVNKIPEDLLEEYLEDYYNLIKKDDSWTFQKISNEEENVTSKLNILSFYAEKN